MEVKAGQKWKHEGVIYTIDEVVEEDMGIFACYARVGSSPYLIDIRTYTNEWELQDDNTKTVPE